VDRGIPFKGCYNTKSITVDHSGESAWKVPQNNNNKIEKKNNKK
jgi:hypothetical protein